MVYVSGMKTLFVLIVVIAALAFGAYIRMAPSDPVRWHIDPTTAVHPNARGDLRRVRVSLADFDATARRHSQVLAGSLEAGHITYVVRSRVFGFPDYITARQVGADLVILSRARFGHYDLGVNARRLDAWLSGL